MSTFLLIVPLILWKICVSDAASFAVFAHSGDEAIPGYCVVPLPFKNICSLEFSPTPNNMVYTVLKLSFFRLAAALFDLVTASELHLLSVLSPVGAPSVKRITYLGFLSSLALSNSAFAALSPTAGSVPPFAFNSPTNFLSEFAFSLTICNSLPVP